MDEDRPRFETAQRKLREHRIPLAAPTDWGRGREEIGLFPRDRKMLHGARRNGRRSHRWLSFDEAGAPWVWQQGPDRFWTCLGPEMRVFGPFSEPHYAAELAGLLAAELVSDYQAEPRERWEAVPRSLTPAQELMQEPLPERIEPLQPRAPRERKGEKLRSPSRVPAPPDYG